MITTMPQITAFLLSKGFYESAGENDEHCKTFGKNVDGVMFMYRIIIDDKYIMMQADPVMLFDRWANCLFEATFDSWEDFINNWYKYLENYNCDIDR